jgi:23S rRNA (guanosine2251-2'-O)-methyltransferase
MSRVVFGIRPIEELCRARPREVVIVYVADGYRSKEIETAVAVAKDRGITVEFRPRALVADLAASPNHQGMAAVAGEFQYARIDEMLAAATAANEPALLLILDCITDPQNFGALVRSAEVLGAHGVIVPDKHAAPVTGGWSRLRPAPASACASPACTTCLAPSTGCASKASRCGAAPPKARFNSTKPTCAGPVALIVGGEGRGLRTAVARRCSSLVQIPQRGHVASLNASVAGAILLYEAVRQRGSARGV